MEIFTPLTDDVIRSLHVGEAVEITRRYLHRPGCRAPAYGGSPRQG